MLIRNLFAVSFVSCIAAAGQANTIHVAFDPEGGDWSTVDTLGDGVVVSAGVNGTDTWNETGFTGTAGAIADLKLASGVSSGASLAATYTSALNLGGGFDIAGKAGANDDFAMMDGILNMNDTHAITVAGLSSAFTANGYTVTVYTSHGDTRTTTFTIIDPISGTATATTQQPTGATFNGDFTGYSATLSGLTSSGFTLTGDSTQGNNSYFLSGLTITAVPEPGSLALLGLGGLMIARRRRD